MLSNRELPNHYIYRQRMAIMKEKTRENVYKAFIGEAKAYFRLLAYAEKADEEEVPQIALLFRAIAEAERVHAMRHMNLMKDLVVKDTDTNLEKSFQREKSISENEYPDMLKEAEEEGEKAAANVFSQARDAEGYHAKLYDRPSTTPSRTRRQPIMFAKCAAMSLTASCPMSARFAGRQKRNLWPSGTDSAQMKRLK